MKKIKNSFEKHDLFKIVSIIILFTLILTWIIPYGYISSGSLKSYGLGRLGITDLLASFVYAANFFLQQILFLIVVGIFYAILSKMSSYKVFIQNVAKRFKGKEKIFVLLSSLLVALSTSLFTQTFIVFLFIPFLIQVAKELNLDKLTSFLATFGSILIGLLGATYGTESLIYFVNYLQKITVIDVTLQVAIRFGILAINFFIFHFFTIRHMNKILGKKRKEEEKIDDFIELENTTEKHVKTWPFIIGFLGLFLIVILGYIDWNTNFGITLFEDFHNWLTKLSIGDYTIISYILGNNAAPFGNFQVYTIYPFIAIVLLFLIIKYHITSDEILEVSVEGIKKLVKPITIILLAYCVFVFVYWCPFTVVISNWLINLTSNFNPFITSLAAAISSFFHLDFGFTGYVLGDLMVAHFGTSFDIGFIIYTAMNGFVQFIAPTSVFLLLGLSYLNIPFKKWLQHIWKFLLAILAVLLIIFALLTYI